MLEFKHIGRQCKRITGLKRTLCTAQKFFLFELNTGQDDVSILFPSPTQIVFFLINLDQMKLNLINFKLILWFPSPPDGRALKFLFLGVAAASQMRWSALSQNTILIPEKLGNCVLPPCLYYVQRSD